MSTIFNKTPLYIAVEKGNRDIVQFLIANENIDVNIANILILIYNKIQESLNSIEFIINN